MRSTRLVAELGARRPAAAELGARRPAAAVSGVDQVLEPDVVDGLVERGHLRDDRPDADAGARRLATELARLLDHLEQANGIAPLWADSRRQVVEQRLEVTDVDDVRIIDDLEYRRVLDAMNAIKAALEAVRSA